MNLSARLVTHALATGWPTVLLANVDTGALPVNVRVRGARAALSRHALRAPGAGSRGCSLFRAMRRAIGGQAPVVHENGRRGSTTSPQLFFGMYAYFTSIVDVIVPNVFWK